MREYELSPYRYREIKYFCMQYGWFKETLEKLNEEDGYATASTDPVSDIAIKREQYKRVIEMIEKTAEDTEPFLKNEILKIVTEDVSTSTMSNQCSRECLEELRRKYFWLLSERKGV